MNQTNRLRLALISATLIFTFVFSTANAQINSAIPIPARLEAETPAAFYDTSSGNSGSAQCSLCSCIDDIYLKSFCPTVLGCHLLAMCL